MSKRKRPEGQLRLPYKLRADTGKGAYTPWPIEGYHTRAARKRDEDVQGREAHNGTPAHPL
jgi:hypothetical protein